MTHHHDVWKWNERFIATEEYIACEVQWPVIHALAQYLWPSLGWVVYIAHFQSIIHYPYAGVACRTIHNRKHAVTVTQLHRSSIQFSSVSHAYLPSTNCGLVQLLVLIFEFPVEGVALCPCCSPTSWTQNEHGWPLFLSSLVGTVGWGCHQWWPSVGGHSSLVAVCGRIALVDVVAVVMTTWLAGTSLALSHHWFCWYVVSVSFSLFLHNTYSSCIATLAV